MAQSEAHCPHETTLHTSPSTSEGSCLGPRFALLLIQKGIPSHQHVSFVAQHCKLSVSQARRKLLGASWSFAEAKLLARELDISLDNLCTDERTDCLAVTNEKAQGSKLAALEATLLSGDASIPCTIKLGTRITSAKSPDALIAIQLPRELIVGTATELAKELKHGQIFHVNELRIYQPDRAAPVVAILDDDPESSTALCEWFGEAGYEAVAYSSGDQLLAEAEDYDAFVVDFFLSDGEVSTETIAEIRLKLPEAPIALLTGKLRDGLVSEFDLAPILRTQNVLFFEKPVRPSVLAAALQSGLDRIALQQQSKATYLVP